MDEELQEDLDAPGSGTPDVAVAPADAPGDSADLRERVASERAQLERELELEEEEHDLLDEPVLPLFGLSAATLFAIFVGGALGTLARYLLAADYPTAPGSFPWVTLLANLTGSFVIGLLVPVTEHVSHRAPWARPFLMIGFLGGWTTYSSLAVDASLLVRHGDLAAALGYLVATVAGGLALVVGGHALGRREIDRRVSAR